MLCCGSVFRIFHWAARWGGCAAIRSSVRDAIPSANQEIKVILVIVQTLRKENPANLRSLWENPSICSTYNTYGTVDVLANGSIAAVEEKSRRWL